MELHAGIFSGLVQLVAEFGCKFPDDAELSGLRLQHEVVCLGFVFDLLSNVVAHCCSVDGLQHYGERILMGGLHRYRNDTNNRHLQSVKVFSVECVFRERKGVFSTHLHGRCCTQYRQSGSGSVVVTGTCVTTPLNSNTIKTKRKSSVHTHIDHTRSIEHVSRQSFYCTPASLSWSADFIAEVLRVKLNKWLVAQAPAKKLVSVFVVVIVGCLSNSVLMVVGGFQGGGGGAGGGDGGGGGVFGGGCIWWWLLWWWLLWWWCED